ncbi:fibronectin type III domain-containing protein [Candidatus Woesearchaeota archaeon]|nr:fibronectin type III domain-containing protein [Candidatus Woesearchaeota archaeon]
MTAVNITWTASADNDSDTINYTVLINNTLVCDTQSLSCNTTQLPSWNGNAAFYIFNVTAFDQEWNSTTTTYAFMFDNTTPTMSIIALTPANNTFQNTTSYFINLSVTEGSVDRVILNITGPSFATASSSGRNITLWDKDLVGMWHFEENANDSSGYNNDGTRGQNAAFNSTCRLGGCANFTLAVHNITIADSASLNFTQFTIQAWIRIENLSGRTTDFPNILGKQLSATNRNYVLYVRNDTGIFFGSSSFSGSQQDLSSNVKVMNTTQGWHNVAYIVNSTHQAVYVDGTRRNTASYTGTADRQSSPLIIAKSPAASGESLVFNGTIDEVKIWRRALSAGEISAEYNRTASNYLASHIVSGAAAHTFSLNMTNLTNGNYSWFAWVNDSSSAVAATTATTVNSAVGQREFKVDLIPPAISFVANTPANQSVLPTSYIFINTSENDAGNDHNELSAFIDFNSSLVGYWRFEDDGDTNASDFTNNNNNGTLTSFGCMTLNCNLTGGTGGTGSGWTSAGKRGKALKFDGENDFVNVSYSESLNLTNLTAIAWVYLDRQSPASYVDIVSRQSVFRLEVAAAPHVNRFSFVVYNTTLGQSALLGTNSLSDGWHHVAGVFNGTHYTIFTDGNRSNSAAFLGSINHTSQHLTIGASLFGVENFNGSIDEVQIWNRVLDAQEINASYQAGVYRLFRNFTGLNDGNYSFRAFVVDASGNMNVTDNRTFSVDTTAPSLSFIATTDANASFLNRSFTIVNVSTTETSEHSVFVDFNRSMVGYWRFEDDADTNASDFSTYSNNGTLVGFGCTTADCNLTGGDGGTGSGFTSAGKRGKAMMFDGVDDLINTSKTYTQLGISKELTIEAWIKAANSNGMGRKTIVGDNDNLILLIANASSARASRHAYPQGANASFSIKAGFFHVTATYSDVRASQTNEVKLYVDGEFMANVTITNSANNPLTELVRIGHDTATSGRTPWNGSLDEVKIWNRVLNDTEINASYQAGTYRYTKNFTGLNDGNYSYYAAVVDSAGTLVQTVNRTVYVDTVGPAISLIANTPANQSVLSSNYIFINTSENDGGNDHNELSAFIDFNRSLVGYWRFEDDGDTNASDFTNNNNNGTLVGFGCTSLNCNASSGWTSAGKRGKALNFDGVNDRVRNPGLSGLSADAITIEAWFFRRESGVRMLLSRNRFSANEWDLFPSSWRFNNGSTTNQYDTVTSVQNDVWNHLVVTYDKNAGGNNVNVYLNGKLEVSGATGGTLGTGGITTIGSFQDGTTDYFSGTIDEVKIWSRALSAQEINSSYQAGQYRLFRNFTGLADGNYTARAFVVDAAGNMNVTDNRTFSVDTVAPTIAYIFPTEANNSFVNRSFTVVNTTVTETGESSAFINFNNSLVGYWRFEDDGDTNASDFTSNNNNGTLLNFSCTAADCNLTGGLSGLGTGFTSAGKRGKAMAFDGVDDIVRISDKDIFTFGDGSSVDSPFSLTAWIKINPELAFRVIVAKMNALSNEEWVLQLNTNNSVSFGTADPSASARATVVSPAVQNNTWLHIAATYNGIGGSNAAAGMNLYVNGVPQNVRNSTADGYVAMENRPSNVVIGSEGLPAGGSFFNGTIDEVMIWNRNLSAEEINASYQAGTYRLFRNFSGLADANYSFNVSVVDWAGTIFTNVTRNVIIDTTFPLISYGLGSDANGTSLARNYIHLNVTVDELNPRNLTAFLFSGAAIIASQNVSVNKTPSSNNVTFLSVSDGYYNVSVSVRDLADNVNTTPTNRSFTVDTTVPVLAYAAPSFANASFVNVSWIFLNFSFTEINNGTLMIRNGSTNWTNVNASSGYFFYNFSPRADGNYTFFGWINDSSGQVAQTVNRTVYVDTVGPAISLIANTPANQSVLSTNYIFVNTSENDAGSDHNELSAFIDFNNSLVGYWRFEDDGDTNASDFTSYNNNGTLVNFGCTTLNCNLTGGVRGFGSGFTSAGRRGKALNFDGQGNAVNVSDSASLSSFSTYSLEAWIKPHEGTSGRIVRKDGEYAISILGYPYLASEHKAGAACGGAWSSLWDDTALQPDSWYYVAVTYNGSNRTLYVNGNYENSSADTGSLPDCSTPLMIGSSQTFSSVFNGTIDEAKVWNRALSADEINASYSAGVYRLFRNFTGLNDGNYSYRAYVVDAAGNMNVTVNRTFAVDTVAPTIAYIFPTEANNSFVNRSFTVVNTTVTESGESSAFINFNNSLVGYWRFEDDADTNASDFTSNNNNGTLVGFGCTAADCNLTGGAGGVASGFVSSGKRGKGMAFDGVDDYVEFANQSSLNLTGALTIEAWVMKIGSPSNERGIVARYWNYGAFPLNRSFTLDEQSSGVPIFLISQDGAINNNTAATTTLQNNTWYHIAGVYVPSTSISIYVNGVLEGNKTAGIASSILNNPKSPVRIGVTFDPEVASRYFNGSIDEVKIWNRALNESEINASFQAGTYRLFRNFSGLPDANYSFNVTVVDWAGNLFTNKTRNVVVDTTLPLISFGLGSDANGTSLARNYIHLNVSVVELYGHNLTAFLFSGSSIIASQNVSVNTTPAFNNVTFLSVADGYYNISISVRDLADNVNTTPTNRSFTVDTTQPLIDNGSGISSPGFRNVNWAFINYSFTEVNNDTMYIRNGTGGIVTNTTPNKNTTYFWYNFTSLDNANYTFSGWINDTAGRLNTTTNTSIVIDTVFPTVDFGLGSDVNGSSVARNYIHLNITVTELYGHNLTASLFSGTTLVALQNVSVNTTPYFNNVTFLSVSDGYYNITIKVKDMANNTNTSVNRSITVDTTAPVLNYAAPSFANASFVNVSWIFLNFSFTEINNGTLMIRNGSTNWTNVNASSGYFFYNFSPRADGNYTFFGWMNDSSGAVAQTVNRTIFIDTAGPLITYEATSFANATYNKFVTINITANDTANDHNELSAFVDFNGSLVGYWRFEDDGDTNATDFTNNNNNGTLVNFSCTALNCNLTGGTGGTGSGWTSAGKRGKALVFDGNRTHVETSDINALDGTSSLTVEAWVRPTILFGSEAIVAKWDYDTDASFAMQQNPAGAIQVFIADSLTDTGGNRAVTDKVVLNASTWTYVAFVFDGTGSGNAARLKIYADGVAVPITFTGTIPAATTSGNTATLKIGRFGGTLNRYWNGTIDDVKVWNRSLSAAEINASYQAGNYRLITNITSSDSKYANGNFTYYAAVVDAAGNMNRTETRLVVLDNTAPVIAAIRTFSNVSGFFFQATNTTSAVTAYFNSLAAGQSGGADSGGGGQEAIVEVAYTDLYRSSLSGNTTFSDTPSNITRADPTRVAYTIETGSGNATAAVYANDTANNTATATVRFILDINDTVTTDNSSSSFTWFSTNVTINLTAVDVANGSGANKTLYCTYTSGTTSCTPTVEVANPTDFRLPINCSTGSSCTIRVRYYSIDNVSNNESGGANGGQIRESNTVNIATGGSDVQDSLVNNSVITNASFVRQSNITNSMVNGCRVTGSIITRSWMFRQADTRFNCSISDSVVIDSNLTSAVVEKRSYIDPSTIVDSVITNSSIRNSTVNYSRVDSSIFCGNFTLWSADVLNNVLVSGRLEFNDTVYFGPVSLNSICGLVAPSPVGTLAAEPSIVNDSSSVVFKYSATALGYTVTIGSNELVKLDNTSTKSITLNDNGTSPDLVANDAVYSGNYSISALNNESDGNKTIVAQVNDNIGNNWTVNTSVTLDNTPPSAAIVINSNNLNTTSAVVTLNITSSDATAGVKDCRFANEDRIFGSYEQCTIVKTWTLSSGSGLKTVVVEVRDKAGNFNETNDTITLLGIGTVIVSPQSGEIVKGSKLVIVSAPDSATWVTFNITNATNSGHTWNLAGTANQITNDTTPSDGFSQTWTTTATAFANESKFNLTVISYDASGNQLSNDTKGNIEVDNNPPTVTLDVPNANGLYHGVVAVNASASSDTSKVRFEYRRGTGDWTVIGEAVTPPFKVDWSTTGLSDGTNYEVRANATDDAGNSANVSNANIEVDNTAPTITIVNPTAGTEVSGTFNITFTILGTVHDTEIQFDGGAWATANDKTYHLWDTTAYTDTTHAIRVRVNDSVNNTGYSDIRLVTVDNGGAPVILLEPASSGYKSGNVDITVSGPGTTFNVTFNVSNSTGYFNTSGTENVVTLDNVSGDGWSAVWATGGFAEDSIYTITVRAYSASNALLGTDTAVSIEVDNLIPANVTRINITDSPTDLDGNLVINWTSTSSADLDHYNLYRSQTRGFNISTGSLLKSVAGNTTTDNVPAGVWFYKVTAVDNVGRESNASIEANTTIDIVGPTGTMDINATYARDNDTIKFIYTGSATGFTAIVNASEMQKLDARVLHGFETLWETSNNNSLNMTLNSTTTKAGSFSNQLRTNESGALGQNITVDLSAGGAVNLSRYNRLLLWVQANTTGSLFNLTFGKDNYTDFNFTITVNTANAWEQKIIDISTIPVLNRSSVRYLMFNVTTTQPFRALLDGLEASNQISLVDDGTGGDAVANDASYTGVYNITSDNNLTDGAKTIRALIDDGSGNFLAPQDTITLDGTPPNGTVLINEGDLFTITRTVTLNLTFVDATSGVKDCRFSNTEPLTSSYESCQVLKVWTTTTGGGTKTVYFEVRDQAGNINVSIDTITLDVSVPAMAITYPLPGAIVNGSINVTFTGAESTQPQISFDGGNWTNTTASTYHFWNTTNLSEGTHGIRVRDTDAAGNIGYSETLLVTVDNIPGVVTFVQPGSSQVLTGNVTVIAVAPDNTVNMSFWIFNTTSGRSVQVYNDTLVADGWNFSLQTAQFEDGAWDLYVNATDSFGRMFDTASVHGLRFDNNVPTVSLATPANGATVRGTVIINATASSDVKQVMFEYSNNSGTDWQPIGIDFSPSAGWTFAWYTVALNDASTYRVKANATDYAGLSAIGQNTADFTIDNTAPTITITTPAPGSYVNGTTTINFTGNASPTSELSIDGASWTNITNSTSFAWNTAAYNDGTHTLQVRNNDSAGNTGLSGTVAVIVDNTRPTVVIISPLSNTTIKGNVTVLVSTYFDTARLDFYVDNNTGSGWVLRRSDTNKADGWDFAWDTALDCATTGECTGVRLRVNSTDAANLTSNFTVSGLEIDNTAPTVTLLYPPDSATIRGVIIASATGSNDTRQVVFEYSPDSGSTWYTIGTDPSSASGWNITWDTRQVADAATYRVRANATDNAGLSAAVQNTADFTIDNVEAATTIISPKAGTVVSGNFTVTAIAPDSTFYVLFRVFNGSGNFSFNGSGSAGFTNDSSPADGWSAKWNTTAFTDGLYNLSAASYDVNGNYISNGTELGIRVDNNAPTAPTLSALPTFDTDGVVVLEWSNVTASTADVIYYNVYRSTNVSFALSTATKIKNVSSNFNTTTDFPGVNAKYYYKVTAVDNALFESAASNEANTTVSVTAAGALVGTLSVNDTIVKDADAVVFSYSSSATDLNVTINTTEMQRLDNSTRADLRLQDGGAPPDRVADDGVYAALFTISTDNNQSDGNVQLRAIVNDSANNQFLPTINITLDNARPNASLQINNNLGITSSREVTLQVRFNDTFGIQKCRFANEDRDFDDWEGCTSTKAWRLSATDGLKTVVVQVADNAENVNETNDTITLTTVAATTIITPRSYSVVSGNFTVIAVAPPTTGFVLFSVFNGSGNFSFNGSGSAGFTNDSTPADGWSARWNTTAFSDGLYNLSAVSYDVNGNYISNGTELDIRVDNNAPAAVTLTALPAYFNKNIIALNWSPSTSSDVAWYNVYRSNNISFVLSSGALLKNVSTNITFDVVLDGQWFYKVTAVDASGRESAASNEVNVTVVTGAPPSEIFGTLAVNDSIVNNGSSLLFTFAGSATNLNVTINQSEMQKLDNTSGALQLNDSGINGDYLVDDATYSAIYAISMLNNESDGMKQLIARATDIAGNLFMPAVNITLDNTRPNATISIFGISPAGFTNVSTEYTFSRAVTLVMAFNDTAGNTVSGSEGVDSCRFASENLVFSGWEVCQTVKAWLLSDGNGNKTVVVEVRDVAGNVNRTNDTIFLNTSGAGLDVTPPNTPTVVDDGMYTNIDSSLHAKWNSTDHENELLHIPLEWEYRIAFDNFTRRINETWQYAGMATEATVYGMNLSGGTNYTFEVRAINTAGLRSANGTSDGIIVDITPPSAPAVNSTAAQSTWSSNNAVSFNWSSTDSISGVSSYSYVLDTTATTIPDNVPEAESDHTALASSSNDGKSTMLKFNSTGNASAVFVEVKANLSANDVVRVTVQLAEASTSSPDAMGFRVYIITAVPTSFAMNGSNVSLIADTSSDISFVSSILDATSYTVEIPMTTPVTGSRFFVAVAGDAADDNNRHNLLLAVSNSSIDSSTQSYQCGEVTGVCSNTTDTAEYGIKVDVRDLKQDDIWDRAYTVGDGRMYFHVKAKDKAGNFGDTTNYSLLVDTSPPSTPQMSEPSKFTNTTSVTFNWTQSRDADSGVDNYSLQVDNNSDFSSREFYAWVNNVTNYTVTGLTADATYYARVHSRNLAGVNSSLSSSVSTVIDTTAPSITFSKPSSTGVVASQNVVLAVNTNEKAICTYNLNSAPYLNFTYTNSTYHETRVSANTGSNTVLVKCHDTILNENSPVSTTFDVSTTSTASSITLQSPTVFTGDVVRTDVIVTTSSSQRLGELGTGAFTVKINGGSIPASVFDNGAGNYTLVFDSPATNGTYTMGVDVGSATATATLTVRALLFTVQYVQSGISSNSGDRLIYFLAGNFSLGLATDSRSFDKSSTSSALNLTSDARAGTAYIFVTRQSGGVERVEGLLKERKFLDSANPSFGYAIDQDTFVVFTDLEYDDISLAGNKTLTAGRYNLIIENKGFDATLNKTKLEVRVQ